MLSHVYKTLWVGSRGDAKRTKHEFDYVVTVAEKLTIGHKRYEIYDGNGSEENIKLFFKAVEDVYLLMMNYRKILIHCYEGVSRSVSVILGVMMRDGMTFDQAWEIMVKKHPVAGPNKVFVEALRGNLDKIEQQVNECYKEILKRNADYNGLSHYKRQLLEEKIDIERLKEILRNSEEYKKKFGG